MPIQLDSSLVHKYGTPPLLQSILLISRGVEVLEELGPLVEERLEACNVPHETQLLEDTLQSGEGHGESIEFEGGQELVR